MKLPKKLNAMLVDDLEARVKGLRDCMLVDHGALDGFQAFEFRGRVRKAGGRMRVVKNAIAKVAFDRAGHGAFSVHFQGASAVIFGPEEAVLSLAKVITEWNKDKARKAVPVKAGLLAGSAFGAKDVERLAAIPSRKELMAKLAGSLNAPASGLAGALSATNRKLAYALKAVAEQKAKAGAA